MERRDIVEFKQNVSKQIKAGSRWMVQLPPDSQKNYNTVLIRLGKKDQTLEYVNNSNNLAAIQPSLTEKFLNSDVMFVDGSVK